MNQWTRDVTFESFKNMLLKAILSIVLLALPVSAQDSLTYRVNYSTSKPNIVHIAIQPSQPKCSKCSKSVPSVFPEKYWLICYNWRLDVFLTLLPKH